jgi:prepilin-type processing-associated H-X9-DG protein
MRQLVQALVVVLILGTCAGLVLPFVVQVREFAHRIGCENNLRQIGISVPNYQDTNQGRYPAAAMPSPELSPDDGTYSASKMLNRRVPLENSLSWLVDLSPYIEQDNIYSRIDKGQGWDAETNRFAALLSYPVVHCPGSREGTPTSTLWPSHYMGIAGVGEYAAWLPSDDPRAGFFGYYRTLYAKDLVRGQSQTAVAAETSAADGAWTAAGPPTVRGFDPAQAHFGGNHRGGCQVTFADGSARFIDAKVSEAEWRRMVVLASEATPWE